MEQNIQDLVASIRKEGIDKARKEADAIISKAKEEAEGIIREAEKSRDKMIADAEKAISLERTSSEAAIRQAARDVSLSLKKCIEDEYTRILSGKIAAALDKDGLIAIIKENMALEKLVVVDVAGYAATYIHGEGSVAVLVNLSSDKSEIFDDEEFKITEKKGKEILSLSCHNLEGNYMKRDALTTATTGIQKGSPEFKNAMKKARAIWRTAGYSHSLLLEFGREFGYSTKEMDAFNFFRKEYCTGKGTDYGNNLQRECFGYSKFKSCGYDS